MEKDSLKIRAAKMFDIPQDMKGGLLHLEMSGNREVFIENHKGLLELSENEVVLSLGKSGTVNIRGDRLSVVAMNAEEIRLAGVIEGVSFGK